MKGIRVLFSTVVALCLFALCFASCTESDLNQLPSSIKTFVAQYFPNIVVESYHTDAAGNTTVQLRNDATLVFNANQQWTQIDGNGSILPGDLIYDQLPSALYDYLESIDQVDQVYWLRKTAGEISVGLINTEITYDMATQTVVYPSAK